MNLEPQLAFLQGAASMAQAVRQHDWGGSPMGAPGSWPQSLRSVVGVVLGSALPMFVGWGPTLRTIYNDAYAEIMGAKHPGGLDRPFLDIWHEIRGDLTPLVDRVMAGEKIYYENLPLLLNRHGYDEETWFTFSWSPVLDERGAVAGIYCACVETTRSVLAERNLRTERERLRSVFQQSPGFVAVLRGPDYVFESYNDAYQQLVGWRDLQGKPLAEALPEIANQGFLDLLDEVVRTRNPYQGRSERVMLNRQPGAPQVPAYVDFVFQPLLDGTGRVEGVLVQGHDVTEQHEAQNALREADRKKDEFLATLAHELRNPLAPIRTAVQLLSMPTVPEGTRARVTEIIGRQVGHMSRLLDDLIDIARITQGRLLLKKERVAIGPLLDAAVEAARPLIDAKQHRLEIRVSDGSAQLAADPVRIVQVVTNLLNNAAKYTDPHGRITLEAQRGEGALQLSVADTGIGLSPAALANLFVMFAQEQSALDRSEGGLGIGLALVRGLVELHGGSVTAESAGPGLGSRFLVELPLAATEQAQASGAIARAAGLAPSRSVLLADDNLDALELLAEVLRLQGHQVRTAADGVQALELARRHRPEVMVLDIGMPGLNGYEVARQLRSHDWEPRPYLVAATGWGQEEDRLRALSAGFDTHVTKPFDPQLLSDLITGRAAHPA